MALARILLLVCSEILAALLLPGFKTKETAATEQFASLAISANPTPPDVFAAMIKFLVKRFSKFMVNKIA